LNAAKKQPREWVSESRSSSLSAGGVEVAVAFESEISAELQKAIVHDLNLISKPRDWLFLSNAAEEAGNELPEMSGKQFSENFGGYRYRQPSLLDVFDGAAWDPSLTGRLIAKVYVFDSEGVIRNSMPPLIYTDGSWRFFIGQPPT
jgi:hypothetical protein